MKKNTFKSFLAVALLAAAFTSCKDDNPTDNTIIDEDAEYSYVVVARSVSTETAGENTIIQTDVITEGEVSLEDGDTYDEFLFPPFASQWLTSADNDILYNFNYGQPRNIAVYTLNASNKLQRNTGYQVQSSTGTIAGAFQLFEKKLVNLITFVDGSTPKLYVSIYDPATGTHLEKALTLESILGTTPTQTLYFSGIATKDNKFYSSVVVNADPTATAQIVEFTLSGENITTKLITDNRIAYSGSRARSLFAGLLDTDDDGNLYVFSSSYEAGTTLPSGALRINAGSSTFDDYYFDIDAKTDGKSVYKAWHLNGDLFLLQTYTSTVKEINPDVRRLAIADMKNKTVKFVTGLPDPSKIITAPFGISPSIAIDGTTAYVAINTTDQKSAIYAINGTTATATKGLVVDAGAVIGVSKLKKNK